MQGVYMTAAKNKKELIAITEREYEKLDVLISSITRAQAVKKHMTKLPSKMLLGIESLEF